MYKSDVDALLTELRQFGNDHRHVEAKKAKGGLPTRLWETLSAFANADGGVLLLGVDEASGFAVTGVDDPASAERAVGEMCSARMEPPIRAQIGTVEVDGRSVVVIEVPALARDRRPCFYVGEGAHRGSYIRVGDGDRRLTEYEVGLLIADRGQPREDERPVDDATFDDLDAELVDGYVKRLRRDKPRVALGNDDIAILRLTRVLVTRTDAVVVPSVAGLLALGSYPQAFLPQVNMSFVSYPTPVAGQPGPRGERFLDNVSIDGPIPLLAEDAMTRLRQRMARRSVVAGAGRRDVYEYPEEAVREAFVNALAHRDLSARALGTQVQVEMYPDRLQVRSPGGLHGPVSLDDLVVATTSSARNATLYKILENVPLPDGSGVVCENRGSGIRSMIAALRGAGMSLPVFHDDVASFLVVFPNATLLDDETVAWIASLGETGLTDSQILGVARMRRGQSMKNATYRSETGVDSRIATAELRDLVDRGIVAVEGTRRSATYFLPNVTAATVSRSVQPTLLEESMAGISTVSDASAATVPKLAQGLWDALRDGPKTRQQLEDLLDLQPYQVLYRARLLRSAGLVETDGPTRSPTARWRLRQ